jgi:hypothetical protein
MRGNESTELSSFLGREIRYLDATTRMRLRQAGDRYQSGNKGSRIEDIQQLAPDFLVVHGETDTSDVSLRKQLDVAILRRLPHSSLSTDFVSITAPSMLAAAEVKTTVRQRDLADALATANLLASFHDSSEGLDFALIGRSAEVSDSALAKFVADVEAQASLRCVVFLLDGGDRPSMFISTERRQGLNVHVLDGITRDPIIGVNSKSLLPIEALYIWLSGALGHHWQHTMNYQFMASMIAKATSKNPVPGWAFHSHRPPQDVEISFSVGEPEPVKLYGRPRDGERPANTPPTRAKPASRIARSTVMPFSTPAQLPGVGRTEVEQAVMMITLGDWVPEQDTWDESPWSGSTTAGRKGHGYYEGMTDDELLNSARLFWKFKPQSGNWKDIRTAVVVHRGTIKAVLSIERFIGPLWDRYGFVGAVRNDRQARGLVGIKVKARQNPVTRLDLKSIEK